MLSCPHQLFNQHDHPYMKNVKLITVINRLPLSHEKSALLHKSENDEDNPKAPSKIISFHPYCAFPSCMQTINPSV